MYRTIYALAMAGALSACAGGNPNDAGNDVGVGTGNQPLIGDEAADTTEETVADTDPDNQYADFDTSLTVNDVTYDATTDQLVINNLPFDGADNIYDVDATATAALAGTGSSFEARRNRDSSAGVDQEFFAVFRETSNSRVTAVGTDRYLGFGFGGIAAQRLNGTGSLPNADAQYVFTGEYAAVRTLNPDDAVTSVQYVAGTVTLDVDVQDFDVVGAVEGIIANRRFFNENGIEIGDIRGADFISLATAEIDFDNWTITSSTAAVAPNDPATDVGSASGNWQGMFTGPNGEEVAGIVFVEGTGPIGIDPDSGDYETISVRESGGFVATR